MGVPTINKKYFSADEQQCNFSPILQGLYQTQAPSSSLPMKDTAIVIFHWAYNSLDHLILKSILQETGKSEYY
uniref:Uncharacterized protein n=1 Tax=Gossypium raimondii TaxID=29730 RepID=A0A0D2VFQ1_GOSRA|nr:hypothetical protein B456_013G189800 [Gossypium raimondii]